MTNTTCQQIASYLESVGYKIEVTVPAEGEDTFTTYHASFSQPGHHQFLFFEYSEALVRFEIVLFYENFCSEHLDLILNILNCQSILTKVSADVLETNSGIGTEIRYIALYTGEYRERSFSLFLDAFLSDVTNFDNDEAFNSLWQEDNNAGNESGYFHDEQNHNPGNNLAKDITEEQLMNVIEQSDIEISSIFDKLNNIILPELESIGVATAYAPQARSLAGFYQDDHAPIYIEKHRGVVFFKNPNLIILTVYMDIAGQQIDARISISINFSFEDTDIKEKTLELFHQHLGKHFDWSGDNADAMIISYHAAELH
jgi:hypothetical protein